MIARLFFLLFVCVALVVACVGALLPSYTSPTSRLWGADWGYPALQRKLNRPIPVETAVAGVNELSNRIAATGSLSFDHVVPVNVEVGGIVQGLRIRPGDAVEAGSPVLSLDTGGHTIRLARIDLALKEKQLKDSEDDLQRKRDNFARHIIEIDAVRANEALVRDAVAALEVSKEKLASALATRSQMVATSRPAGASLKTVEPQETKVAQAQGPHLAGEPLADAPTNGSLAQENDMLVVPAPISGTVVDVAVNEGENIVGPRQRVATIGDHLIFQAYVDQRYFGSLTVGDSGLISLSSSPGVELKGRISQIDPTVVTEQVARSTGQPPLTFGVELEFEQPSSPAKDFAAGMSGYFLLSRFDQTIAVPTTALVRYSGGSGYVFVLRPDGVIDGRPVEYSLSDQGLVAIETGLSEGERVVVSGQVGLRPGDKACPLKVDPACTLALF